MPVLSLPKRHRTYAALLFLSGGLFLKPAQTSSPGCPVKYEHTYMSWEEFRTPVSGEAPKAIEEIGNIVVYGDLLLVPEPEKGIHLIDNSNPAQPEKSSFIPVVGVEQIAVVNDVLLARSYVDLVAIDISNPLQAMEVSRLEDVFPYEDTPGDGDSAAFAADQTQGVVIDVTWHNLCASSGDGFKGGTSFGGCGTGGAASSAQPVSNSSRSVGVAGSMATMLLVDQHLYLLSRNQVITLSVAEPAAPVLLNKLDVSWNMETVYYHNDALYIGTSTGVQILDISHRDLPTMAGLFEHPWQCDPVVVSGTTAYSTLRSGVGCGGVQNQLDILDVSDIQAPQLITSVELTAPYGLAIEGDTLFIADGSAGLKMFNVADTANPVLTQTFTGYTVEDVIVNNGHGVLQGSGNIVQINYSDMGNIEQLSVIGLD